MNAILTDTPLVIETAALRAWAKKERYSSNFMMGGSSVFRLIASAVWPLLPKNNYRK
jgi:hypothetical protein